MFSVLPESSMANPPYRYDDPLGYRLWNPTLLERLLEQHGIANQAVDLAGLWCRFAEQPDSVPVALLDALFHVRELADDHGHEELIDGMGGPLFVADAAALPPRDVSLLAYLDHRDLFNRVRGRRVISATRRFREFKGREVLSVDLPDAESVQRLERRLGRGFERRNRSLHCRIHAYALDGLHHFDITHGRPRLRDGALDERGDQIREAAVEYRPQQVDRVSYDPNRGVLRVTARDARTTRAYCDCFGELLFGQIGWFSDAAVLTLTPLVHDPVAALRPTRGIRDVRLVYAQVVCPGRVGMDLMFRSEDVFAGLAEHGGVSLDDGQLTWVSLKVTYVHGGTRITKLGLPNHVTYNNHRDEPVIRQFLEERGFLDGPMRFRMAS